MSRTAGADEESAALEQKLLATLEAEITSNRLVLPSLPEVALRARELTAQPDCSATQLARVIGSDAALAARLIKVANSSSYRSHKTIDNIQAAITRLGLQLVRALVTQLALLQSLHGGGSNARQLATLARHSIEVGAHCHAIAARYTRLDPEEAMLAGLVHDIGKLPLLPRVRTLAAGHTLAARQAALTDSLLLRLHDRVGAKVLKAWHFAPDMVEVAAKHEDLQRTPYGALDYTDVVQLAHLLVYLRQGAQQQWTVEAAQASSVRKLDITPLQLLADQTLLQHADATLARFSA